MDIEFPGNLEIFSNYLKVAAGDVGGLNNYIPSISTFLIDQSAVESDTDDDIL